MHVISNFRSGFLRSQCLFSLFSYCTVLVVTYWMDILGNYETTKTRPPHTVQLYRNMMEGEESVQDWKKRREARRRQRGSAPSEEELLLSSLNDEAQNVDDAEMNVHDDLSSPEAIIPLSKRRRMEQEQMLMDSMKDSTLKRRKHWLMRLRKERCAPSRTTMIHPKWLFPGTRARLNAQLSW